MCSEVKVIRFEYYNMSILQLYNRQFTTEEKKIIKYISEMLKGVQYEFLKKEFEISFLHNLIEDYLLKYSPLKNYEIFIILTEDNYFYIAIFDEGEIIDIPMNDLMESKKILH